MSVPMILLPLFVQVALALALGLVMAVQRRKALLARQPRWQDIALREPNWPPAATRVANAYANQFELPLLFYVLTILVLMTRQADLLFVVMAWIFVVTRLAHALVHATSNHVPTRGAFFGIGFLVLALMWVIFMIRILALP